MKIRNIIVVCVVLILGAAMVALKVLPDDKSYVKEDDGIYQHIVLESGDVQLELRNLLIDPYHMTFEYAVTKDGTFADGYEVSLNMPDVYDKPIKLSIDNENMWQEYQINIVNDLHDKTTTTIEATIEKDGDIITFIALDLDLSNYTIFFIGDVMINKTIMLNECSVEIIKMRCTKNTVDLYYDVQNTEDSFVSYLHFNLYSDDGTKYKTDSTEWSDSSMKVAKFNIDEAFNNSDSIKIESNQANVTNIIETFDFSNDGMNFDYEGYQYSLNLTDTVDYQLNLELVCESEELPAFPDLVYKTNNGWDDAYPQTDDDVLSISSVYIPDFVIVDDLDYKLSSQNVVEFYEEHYNKSYDVEAIQVILPTILNKEVKVCIQSDGSLMKSLEFLIWDYENILKIGIASPNDINIITESIEVDLN